MKRVLLLLATVLMMASCEKEQAFRMAGTVWGNSGGSFDDGVMSVGWASLSFTEDEAIFGLLLIDEEYPEGIALAVEYDYVWQDYRAGRWTGDSEPDSDGRVELDYRDGVLYYGSVVIDFSDIGYSVGDAYAIVGNGYSAMDFYFWLDSSGYTRFDLYLDEGETETKSPTLGVGSDSGTDADGILRSLEKAGIIFRSE